MMLAAGMISIFVAMMLVAKLLWLLLLLLWTFYMIRMADCLCIKCYRWHMAVLQNFCTHCICTLHNYTLWLS